MRNREELAKELYNEFNKDMEFLDANMTLEQLNILRKKQWLNVADYVIRLFY